MDSASEQWREVWHGADPAPIGRLLDAEGIPMRLATTGNWCGFGGGVSFLSLFRRKPQSRLLVPASQLERARALIQK
jgi:hypothetical protein